MWNSVVWLPKEKIVLLSRDSTQSTVRAGGNNILAVYQFVFSVCQCHCVCVVRMDPRELKGLSRWEGMRMNENENEGIRIVLLFP